jgi:hypothetical protein
MSRENPKCRCGLPKQPGKAVCLCCWHEAPAELRTALHNPHVIAKRVAFRRLLEFAYERGKKIELSFRS